MLKTTLHSLTLALTLALPQALLACSDDDSSGTDAGLAADGGGSDVDAALDATTSDAGEDAAADAAEPFVPTGVVAGLPWGPSFFGIASDVNDDNAPDDNALGVIWDPAQIAIDYHDDSCFAVHTRKGQVVGQDVGTPIVHYGSGVTMQALTQNDQGYYYLDEGDDPWHEGDAVRVVIDDDEAGPAQIPSALTQTNLTELTSLSRAQGVTIEASGSDGSLVAISVAGATETDSYMLVCAADAATGEIALTPAALAVFPDALDGVHLKLQAANAADGETFRLLAAGPSKAIDLPLLP